MVLGIACAVGGPLLDEAVAAATLDATLTPDELRDEDLLARTRATIQRTANRYWPLWIGFGGSIAAVGAIGLRATTRLS
jgi:hypothetical protein